MKKEEDELQDLDEMDDYDYDVDDGEWDTIEKKRPEGGGGGGGKQPERAPSSSKGILTFVIICAAIVALVSGGFLIMRYIENREAQKQIETLQKEAEASKQESSASVESQTVPESQPETNTAASETLSSEPEPERVANPYADSYAQNSDMAAWISVPDTIIDYPVMQTMKDENYYLYRGFDRKDNKNGCLILDTDSTLEPIGTNLIIHGHNMKSGAMFRHLFDYEDKSFFENHRYMKLYTKECERNYEVIAVFYTQVYKKTDDVFKFYKFFQADTEEEFLDYYDNIKEMSLYDTGVTAEFGNRFLTLSTCSYQVENGRFVVVAKEIEPGASYLPLE